MDMNQGIQQNFFVQRAIVLSLQSVVGTRKFHRTFWQHAASWKSKYICYQCRATSIGQQHTFVDLRDEPSWASTEHTNMSFINGETSTISMLLGRNFGPKMLNVKSQNLVHGTGTN